MHRAMLTSLGSGVAMPQNCALQLLFNVRFLCSILSSPKEMEVSGEPILVFTCCFVVYVDVYSSVYCLHLARGN